jgi:hypothetical protein
MRGYVKFMGAQMQGLAIIESTEPLTCDDWLAIGKSIASAHREKQWEMADWFAYGKRRAKEDPQFASQMALALPEITEDPKRLEQAAKVAEAFPIAERTLALSFDHYSQLTSLPHGEARKLLERAEREHIPPRKMIDVAQRPLPSFGDDELLSGFLKHWNRLPRVVRLDAAEMIAESDGEEIEP